MFAVTSTVPVAPFAFHVPFHEPLYPWAALLTASCGMRSAAGTGVSVGVGDGRGGAEPEEGEVPPEADDGAFEHAADTAVAPRSVRNRRRDSVSTLRTRTRRSRRGPWDGSRPRLPGRRRCGRPGRCCRAASFRFAMHVPS